MPERKVTGAASPVVRSVDVDSLLSWWREHKREYPWRAGRDPFKALFAEFMLRRTRADQVVPVYRAFVSRFSSAADVLKAQEREVLDILAPLGLRWRNIQLRSLCEALVARHGGDVPSDHDDLLALPGVGPYVAAAVRVFAFGQPDPLIDTNVLRLLSRHSGVELVDSQRRSKSLLTKVGSLVPTERPREFWWSVLDLAALVCKPRTADHAACPLSGQCAAAADARSTSS